MGIASLVNTADFFTCAVNVGSHTPCPVLNPQGIALFLAMEYQLSLPEYGSMLWESGHSIAYWHWIIKNVVSLRIWYAMGMGALVGKGLQWHERHHNNSLPPWLTPSPWAKEPRRLCITPQHLSKSKLEWLSGGKNLDGMMIWWQLPRGAFLVSCVRANQLSHLNPHTMRQESAHMNFWRCITGLLSKPQVLRIRLIIKASKTDPLRLGLRCNKDWDRLSVV